jgi:hypothetical protein
VRYAGGYSERKQGPVFEDVDTMLRLRAEAKARSLPIFGCAVSRDQNAFDPLALAAALGI